MLLQYKWVLSSEQRHKSKRTLREKCSYLEFSDPNFTHNSTEYEEI